MNTSSFSIRGVFVEAWSLTKKNIWLFTAAFTGYFILFLLIGYLLGMFDHIASDPNKSLDVELIEIYMLSSGIKSNIAGFLASVLTVFFAMGAMKMALNAKDGAEPSPADFANSPKMLLQYFVFSIIYGIIVSIGLALCIVPGLLLIARLQFAGYFILEEDCNFLEALSKSWECTKGKTWKLVLFTLLLFVLIAISPIFLLVGFFVAAPFSIVALTLVYRRLLPIAGR